MTQRSDAPLIRHLTQTYGPETAKDWQRPPLVVLPGKGFMQHLIDTSDHLVQEVFTAGAVRQPWADCILDYRDGYDAFSGNGGFIQGYFIRVRSGEMLIGRTRQTAPWMGLDDNEQMLREAGVSFGPHSVYLEIWPRLPRRTWGEFMDHPVMFAFDLADEKRTFLVKCAIRECLLCTEYTKDYRDMGKTGAVIALATLQYLTQCNEYLTKVTPTSKPLPKNQAKVHEAKPWLKETLPHYILLDPTRVAEYGHPSGIQAPVGHHASPHPHTRRGHWAALKHDKFARNEDGSIKRVWRKQAWVGATEWTDGLNQRYRVVLPIEQDDSQRVKLAERERVTSTVSTSSAHAGI